MFYDLVSSYERVTSAGNLQQLHRHNQLNMIRPPQT